MDAQKSKEVEAFENAIAQAVSMLKPKLWGPWIRAMFLAWGPLVLVGFFSQKSFLITLSVLWLIVWSIATMSNGSMYMIYFAFSQLVGGACLALIFFLHAGSAFKLFLLIILVSTVFSTPRGAVSKSWLKYSKKL